MKTLNIAKLQTLDFASDEAVNTLCTNLSFSGENVKKIMVTSTHATEGKTYISMNVMRTMAKLGKTVAFVDADLRKSLVNSRYNVEFEEENSKGLAHYLAGRAELDEVIYATNFKGAYMVPVGRTVSNPLQLLNSQRFANLLNDLAERVDYVIVDAPPVGTVIDAAQIAKSCDGTLVVVKYNSVRRKDLIEVVDQLSQTGCPILGAVLNGVEYETYLNRKYYYKSYYSKYGKYGSYGYYSRDAREIKERHSRTEEAETGDK